MGRVLLLALGVAIAACGDDASGDPAPADAGPLCLDEPGETCTACYEAIGTCCYEDATIMGNVPALVASCEREPLCVRCCAECAAMDCATLLANHDCPNMLPRTSPLVP